jgi:hypothetical protein
MLPFDDIPQFYLIYIVNDKFIGAHATARLYNGFTSWYSDVFIDEEVVLWVWVFGTESVGAVSAWRKILVGCWSAYFIAVSKSNFTH